jgi:hypothetical protein
MTTNLAVGFGRYVAAGDVRDALRATIEMWIHTYLAELARHEGRDPSQDDQVYPDFRSYPDSLDLSRFPEEQLPSCVLVVPGIPDQPQKTGQGELRGEWKVAIGICVTGQDKTSSLRIAQSYTTAVRMLLLQKQSLGGFATHTTLLREEFTGPLIHAQDSRTLGVGALEFLVGVDGLVDISQGPTTPIPDNSAPTGWSTVESPIITVNANSPS